MFFNSNSHCRTEVYSYPKKVPTFFFLNRSFVGVEPPEGLENVPEIMTIFFSKLVIWPRYTLDRLSRARKERNFLEDHKNRGANLLDCFEWNELDLASWTCRRSFWSPPSSTYRWHTQPPWTVQNSINWTVSRHWHAHCLGRARLARALRRAECAQLPMPFDDGHPAEKDNLLRSLCAIPSN